MSPRRAELEAAQGRTVPDVVGSALRVLFCGINPGLTSALTGHHFAGPGNRFWPALFGAGFTDRLLGPGEQSTLPSYGIGITNLVARATATAAELGRAELEDGVVGLEAKVDRLRPTAVAFLGMGAYRTAFGRPKAPLGLQNDTLGASAIWLLPNPSGLQARYQLPELVSLFTELRLAVERPEGA